MAMGASTDPTFLPPVYFGYEERKHGLVAIVGGGVEHVERGTAVSVAFRRESDDEHLEPKFELPIPPGPNLVTLRGLAQIEERAAALEEQLSSKLPEEERKKVLRDARYWRQRLASAQLVPTPTGKAVAVGTKVTYAFNGNERTIFVVGHDESEPATDRVSFLAPVVRAMLGAEEGEEVDYAGGTLTVLGIAAS